MSYLQHAFLLFLLPNYAGSESSRQKRGRKVYFVDGAVRNAALQRGLAPLSDPAEMGLLIENLVAGHLHALSQHSHVRLYHWRDGENEVDIIYDHPTDPLVFEISSSTRHSRNGLYALQAKYPRFKECYLVAPGLLPSLPSANWDHVGTLPLELLLVAISLQAEKELSKQIGALRS
jgi:predicted AAA+ superfamily ATPase